MSAETNADSALDPDSVRSIVEHMNDDHADALRACARAHAGIPEGRSVRMTGIDRRGIVLRCGDDPDASDVRIDFPEPLSGASDARRALVDLTRRARALLD